MHLLTSCESSLALSNLVVYGKGFFRLANRSNRFKYEDVFNKEQFVGGESIMRKVDDDIELGTLKEEIYHRIENHLR